MVKTNFNFGNDLFLVLYHENPYYIYDVIDDSNNKYLENNLNGNEFDSLIYLTLFTDENTNTHWLITAKDFLTTLDSTNIWQKFKTNTIKGNEINSPYLFKYGESNLSNNIFFMNEFDLL
jgi:hypothetical protein